tara:strand:- start:625 stop:1194 length:570 start_codon:yes stop_codon:yes gene_type:complete
MQLIHISEAGNMALGENLQRLRKARGLKQEELAERAGVSITQISKIERNETDPRASTIEKLTTALGCSADKLLFDKEAPGLDGMMKNALERAERLRPRDKGTLLSVIYKFCAASVMMRELNYYDIEDEASSRGMSGDDMLYEIELDEQAAMMEEQELEELVRSEETAEKAERQAKEEAEYRSAFSGKKS